MRPLRDGFITEYVTDRSYTDRYIRNRPTRLRMVVNNVETVLETNTYDVLTDVHPCGSAQSFPTPPPNSANLYDASYDFILHRGNLTTSIAVGKDRFATGTTASGRLMRSR